MSPFSIPIEAEWFWLAMSITGDESAYAVPSEVIAFSAAGPVVVMHTPGMPEARA
jgi:hypothetical protein